MKPQLRTHNQKPKAQQQNPNYKTATENPTAQPQLQNPTKDCFYFLTIGFDVGCMQQACGTVACHKQDVNNVVRKA
jgi:hypothetical protein